jgi:hypothetical protein
MAGAIELSPAFPSIQLALPGQRRRRAPVASLSLRANIAILRRTGSFRPRAAFPDDAFGRRGRCQGRPSGSTCGRSLTASPPTRASPSRKAARRTEARRHRRFTRSMPKRSLGNDPRGKERRMKTKGLEPETGKTGSLPLRRRRGLRPALRARLLGDRPDTESLADQFRRLLLQEMDRRNPSAGSRFALARNRSYVGE